MNKASIKFTPPNYDDFYIFRCEYGEVRCLKADYNDIRKRRVDWAHEHPLPDAPLVPITPSGKNWKFKHARQARDLAERKGMTVEEAELIIAQKLDPVQDPDSEEYEVIKRNWEWQRFVFVEGILLTRYTLYETRKGYRTLEHIVVDTDDKQGLVEDYVTCDTTKLINTIADKPERLEFNEFFISISSLTWAHVLSAGDQIGLLWKGNPVLRAIPSGSSSSQGEQQSIFGLGVLAAHAINMSPTEFSVKSIDEQAMILAQYLIQKWLERFNYIESRQKQSQMTSPEAAYRTQ